MVVDKKSEENLEEGQMPRIDGYLLDDISDSLQLIGDLFKTCNEFSSNEKPNPLVELFSQLWPFIDKILTEFVLFDEIVEAACRLIKHSMRALGPGFTEYLPTFIKKAMHGYEQNSIGSFVYTVEFCFTQYGQKPEFAGLFQEAFEFICQ